MADQWRKVKGQSERIGVSERTFRGFLKAGMRHVRLPSGLILVWDRWADEYLEQFEVGNQVDAIVDEVVRGL